MNDLVVIRDGIPTNLDRHFGALTWNQSFELGLLVNGLAEQLNLSLTCQRQT